MRCFVTVGSTEFDALINAVVERNCLESLNRIGITDLLIQMGRGRAELEKGNFFGVNINYYRYKDDILQDINEADLIIGHAGAGTCLEVLRCKKPLVVVVNEELMDNHQWELAKRLHDLGHIFCSSVCDLAEIVRLPEIFKTKPFAGPDYSALANAILRHMRIGDASIILNFKIDERQSRAEKEYIFCLSRDDDPLFIYTLSLRRSEYDLLKREQELDVEFDAFPKKIVDFITCLDSGSGSHLRGGLYDDNSLFRFELVGKMGFKWVTVLSLLLRRVTDNVLVTHLVERIKKHKEFLKELDTLRNLLLSEQAENRSLHNSLAAKEKLHMDCLQRWEEERKEAYLVQFTESKNKIEELNEELREDNEMLKQEVRNLTEVVADWQGRFDGLVEQVNQLEDRVHVLTEELDASTNQLRDLEQKKEELQQELNDKDEEMRSRIFRLRDLKDTVDDVNRQNKELRQKLQFVNKEIDHWKNEHDKAVTIIKKLYSEKARRIAVTDGALMNEKVVDMEKDLEERKKAIDALTDSNTQLRTKLENLLAECELAKKDAEMWKAKCEKKETLIADLIQFRRTPIISPSQQQINLTCGNKTPIVYPRVLGVKFFQTNWTAQITTPLRNLGVTAKTPGHQKENELNSVAITPPTEVQTLTGLFRANT